MNAYNFIQEVLKRGNSSSPKEKGAAFAPANIALIKYWGKRNVELNLPKASSLSLTLPEKGAHTTLRRREDRAYKITLNGEEMEETKPFAKRISQFLDYFQPLIGGGLEIETRMNIPSDAGLASSSCGFAALTLALYPSPMRMPY